MEYYNSLLSKADILRAECVSPDNDTTITTIDNAKTGLNSKKTILESNHNDKQTCMSVNQLVAGNHCYNKQYKGYLPSKKSDDVMITRHVDAKLDTIAPFILTDDKFSSSFNTAEIYIGHFYYGGISIGVCEHENCESSIFNGINIAYFGDNCYHVDYFIINEYIGTKRTCLSKYELYHLYFKIEGSTFSIGLEKEVPDYYFYSAKVDNHVSICGSLLNKMTTLKIIRTYLLSKFVNVHLYHKLQSNY